MSDTKRFQQLIEQKISSLTRAGQDPDNDVKDVTLDQTRVGRLSRMDALQMQQMELAMDRRQQQELAGLRRALERIEAGEFGECVECGDSINPKRLEIDPTASRCIKCAEALEAR